MCSVTGSPTDARVRDRDAVLGPSSVVGSTRGVVAVDLLGLRRANLTGSPEVSKIGDRRSCFSVRKITNLCRPTVRF